MLNPEDIKTVAEAQAYLLEGMQTQYGVECPCCQQRVKLYKRGLNSSMARMLIALHKINDGVEWTYIEEWRKNSGLTLNGGGDYGKLAYWGLVEVQPLAKNVDKHSSGLWRITDKGVAFVLGSLTVPAHVLIYNNEIMGFSGKDVDITKCLGKKFSYKELMKPAP